MKSTQLESKRVPHIVVVGGGAGGLELVTRLGHKLGKHNKTYITLIDQSLTHLWKPLLHEVAAGTLNPSNNEINYFNHAAKHHYHFQFGTVDGIDRQHKQIKLAAYKNKVQQPIMPAREITYDTLVFALGSKTNDFSPPGVKEYCSLLENHQQAEQLHQQLLEKLLSAQYQNSDINVVIVGAGATGVELAAELQFVFSHIHQLDFKKIDPQKIKLVLLEAAPRILAALPEKISAVTRAELEKIGVKILTNERVQKITAEGVYTQGGDFIPANIKVWTAGIKAPEFLSQLEGLETNRINQLVVKPTLQTSHDESIFAMGDCAAVPQKRSKLPVPALAQAAHQEATLLAKSLCRYIQGRSLLTFNFHYHGSLISLSHYSTIGYLMGRIPGRLMVEGFVARVLYLLLYRMHQFILIGFWRTVMATLSNLLTRKLRPRLKLH